MTQQIQHQPKPSVWARLIDFLQARLGTILLALLGGALILTFVGYQPSIPRNWRLAGLTMVAIAPYGYIVSKYLVSYLWDPHNIFLVDLDAEHIDGALYRFPAEDWRELDVRNGELTQATPQLYFGKDVDLDAMSVRGTWRGTMSDRELCRALNKVSECRGQLEEDAKRGFAIETQAFTIIRSCVRSATLTVVRTFEEGTLPDEGEAIGKQIDKALERFDFEDQVSTLTEEETEIEPGEAFEGEPVELPEDPTKPNPEPTSTSEAAADD